MTTVDFLELVLSKELLIPELVYVPTRGATHLELAMINSQLPRKLSYTHSSILTRWNGLNLDVLRIYGATQTTKEIKGILESQSGFLGKSSDTILFGDDPSGFLFAEDGEGRILSFDSKSDVQKIIASDMDDFFQRLIFGKDAALFGGDDWADEVLKAGLVF